MQIVSLCVAAARRRPPRAKQMPTTQLPSKCWLSSNCFVVRSQMCSSLSVEPVARIGAVGEQARDQSPGWPPGIAVISVRGRIPQDDASNVNKAVDKANHPTVRCPVAKCESSLSKHCEYLILSAAVTSQQIHLLTAIPSPAFGLAEFQDGFSHSERRSRP